MSVLACDRSNCDNVMCDRYSEEYQAYLCDGCFEELVSLGLGTNVREFLDSEIGPNIHEATRAYFGVIFSLRTYT